MTLANFKSNFNWQYRMLKEAADCCGIVPDLPPTPPPPVVDCYWYAKVHDTSCLQFNPNIASWTLNGVDVFSSWSTLMYNSPYGTIGNAQQYTDNLSGCGPFSFSEYHLWTVVPSTVLSLPPLVGNDSDNNPVSYSMLGPICASKCYEGTFRSGLGSFIVYGINTAEFNATDFSFYVDLSDPGVNSAFTTELGRYYPSPPLNVTVTIIGPDEYTIRIDGLYSTSTVVYLYIDDGVTVGELYEIPC
jgi:hypothetical protein